ncbi:MAG TPA: MotA/TolQ/ExbB proton channel family protein [Planctomycetes bacterium]|nr:MotA/TolQ/ExbB proton channel family protein [Planctomycetota bacterium]
MKLPSSLFKGRLNGLSLFSMTVVTSTLFLASTAFAQEGGAASSDKKAPSLLEDILKNAGVIGYVIIGVSILALALIIEDFMSIKREKLAPPHLQEELEALFDEGKFDEAMDVCEAEPCYLTNVVAAGLDKLGHSYNVIATAFQEAAEEEDVQLSNKIGWLSLIAAISPMMGLLGTVNGMVAAFGEIALKPSVKPNDLAAGIKGALITTLLGLVVAIPVTTVYVFLRNRVTMSSIEIGGMVEELFERFRTKDD